MTQFEEEKMKRKGLHDEALGANATEKLIIERI